MTGKRLKYGIVARSVAAYALLTVGVLTCKRHPRFDYGQYDALIGGIEKNLERTPCERRQTLDLIELYAKCSDARSVIDRVASFSTRCGEDASLIAHSAEAHITLKEYQAALTDANRALALKPQEYLYLRAAIYSHLGDDDAALADYEKALSVTRHVNTLDAIVALHKKHSRPCDAAKAIRAFLYWGGDKVHDPLRCDPDPNEVPLEKQLAQFEKECG